MKSGKIVTITSSKGMLGKYNSSVVVAAPHGDHDKYTGDIVREICRNIHVCGVVASDFVNPDTKLRVNINRPTEGAGVSPQEESLTDLSAKMYHKYLRSVLRACDGNLNLYVEVHGNEHPELSRRIEVATWNVSQTQVRRLKTNYKEILNMHCPHLKAKRVGMWVEGVNPIEKRAWANKLFGVLPLAKSALHFEVPMTAREDLEVQNDVVTVLSEVIHFWSKDMSIDAKDDIVTASDALDYDR
jgi:F0F1-type ATP synthase gamma subunit